MTRRRLVPPTTAALRTSLRYRVIYGDTDQMGVVYHGTWLRILEAARCELLRALGAPYARMEREGHGLPVTDLSVSYRSPGRYDDLVSVDVGVESLGAASLQLVYTAHLERGAREGLDAPLQLVVARTHHACVAMDTGRPCALPATLTQALRTLRGGGV